ncbi:dihydroxy-acid dehydratase [Evansella sp. AB-rgal1]|uniref:dihydroxy-acid dehydratase domain-containing protein n=1 Tax=Evansella sp. AB-rgal1 TaxID=3242696 RepID=UPI00359E44CF
MLSFPKIQNGINPYKHNVQGKANEPITVAGLLDRSKRLLHYSSKVLTSDWTLEEIYNRLEENAPRIAIIGGSSDHPAHIMDDFTVSRAAIRIWQNGGVPFYFSTPVLCDGTAQNNQGMSYSLQSRNAVAQMIVNQMEAHSYHGAFVIQGCDKQPIGVVSALVHLDRLRQYRGESPLFATFAPAHVLKGGTIPEELVLELQRLSKRAKAEGFEDIEYDLLDAMSYILQCSSNTAFQGVLIRAMEKGLITSAEHKEYEKKLAVATCDSKGGICAFNGTGNSSRHLIAGMGLVHPEIELLTEPPEQHQINKVIDDLGYMINHPEFGAANIMAKNIKNAIRIHSTTGGSTNLMMHIVAAMLYGGYSFDLWELDKIHGESPIPDLFDYSLTEGRDIFALAMQCCSGQSRGMETLFVELMENGVPMDLDAPTVTGTIWRDRLSLKKRIREDEIKDNRIILSKPKRSFSGVDVLKGNFFESAVVKTSGMTSHQLDTFDGKVAVVLYYENEESANKNLLEHSLLDRLREEGMLDKEKLLAMLKYNAPFHYSSWKNHDFEGLFKGMMEEGILKVAIVISGQGPVAYGMPEMFTPMQHINANRQIKKIATLISDGRYSGVTFGAAVGHMTPEAINDGGILYLQTGDLLQLNFRKKRIDFLDENEFIKGNVTCKFEGLKEQRKALANSRLEKLTKRQWRVAGSNRILYHTDASKGVVPTHIAEHATLDYNQ